MLLTLATRSFANVIASDGERPMSLLDLPDFAVRQLKLRGLNVSASMLAGWSLHDLDGLRDCADKAACPCLVLIEDAPLNFAGSEQQREKAIERIRILAAAANRLGCNALALRMEAPDDDEAFESIATAMRDLMPVIERHELNILIAPWRGLTHCPSRLIDLLKRIGGFRIGSLPSFAHAAEFDDPRDVLRKLAPYAGAIHATVDGFSSAGKHSGCDLAASVEAIRSVGFTNTLSIEYVGEGDPVSNVEQARTILENAIADDDA